MSRGAPATVDTRAVDSACRGDRVRLNRPERREAVARMTAEGRSQVWIAERIGITPRSVCRLRRKVFRDGVYG